MGEGKQRNGPEGKGSSVVRGCSSQRTLVGGCASCPVRGCRVIIVALAQIELIGLNENSSHPSVVIDGTNDVVDGSGCMNAVSRLVEASMITFSEWWDARIQRYGECMRGKTGLSADLAARMFPPCHRHSSYVVLLFSSRTMTPLGIALAHESTSSPSVLAVRALEV